MGEGDINGETGEDSKKQNQKKKKPEEMVLFNVPPATTLARQMLYRCILSTPKGTMPKGEMRTEA